MARTKLTKLKMISTSKGFQSILKAARKSKPTKGGIKLPLSWKRLSARVGAFRRENIRMRMGKLNRYKTALLRMRNISRRKKEAKKLLMLTNPAPKETQISSLCLETIDKLCLIF